MAAIAAGLYFCHFYRTKYKAGTVQGMNASGLFT